MKQTIQFGQSKVDFLVKLSCSRDQLLWFSFLVKRAVSQCCRSGSVTDRQIRSEGTYHYLFYWPTNRNPGD